MELGGFWEGDIGGGGRWVLAGDIGGKGGFDVGRWYLAGDGWVHLAAGAWPSKARKESCPDAKPGRGG